jgi:hypothetical protein
MDDKKPGHIARQFEDFSPSVTETGIIIPIWFRINLAVIPLSVLTLNTLKGESAG